MSDFSQTHYDTPVIRRHSTVRQTGVRAQRAALDPRGTRRVLASFLLLLVSLGFLAVILSGYFRVREVRVVGSGLPRQAIVQASGVVGQNVFSLRTDQVIGRLGAVGQIAVQRVDTAFPGQVTIYARLRVPMVAWRSGGALYLLDPDGHVISRVSATSLPIITSAGTNARLGPGVVAAVREAVQVVPGAPHGAIAGFTYTDQDGLVITSTAGWKAYLGSGSPQTMVTRVATLVEFLRATATRLNLETVDLRGQTPYARYAQ